MRESHPQRPLSPYGVSKKAAGDYLHYYREVHGLEYTELALANVYGPRQDPNGEAGVVAIFAGRMLAGRQPTVYGDGAQTRDYVFVDDVVDAFVRATEKGGGLLMNIGTGVETSVLELYDAMARLAGYARAAATARRARGRARTLGARPRARRDPPRAGSRGPPLDDGLGLTLDWFREPRRLIDVEPIQRTRTQRVVRSSPRGTGGRGRPTYAGSGRPTSDHARGGATRRSRSSASRAASGQKIGAATQHDA